jgi:hypothetical protein
MFRLLCFAIIKLLHYILDTYMCKTIGWDILVISYHSCWATYNYDKKKKHATLAQYTNVAINKQ